jgi:hypothetical protein
MGDVFRCAGANFWFGGRKRVQEMSSATKLALVKLAADFAFAQEDETIGTVD